MFRLFVVLLAIPSTLAAQQVTVRRDTQFPVELRTSVKTDSAKVGNTVEFRTTEAVLIGNNIVVPRDARIVGHIEQVRSGAAGSPRSLFRLRIDTLKWKNSDAALNGIVSAVEPAPAEEIVMHRRRRPFFEPPDFLKGIHIRAHVRRYAFTEFFSDQKNFVLRSGIMLVLRQIDPDHEPAMAGQEPIVDVGPQ